MAGADDANLLACQHAVENEKGRIINCKLLAMRRKLPLKQTNQVARSQHLNM
jgi:hypothetical protein